MAGPVTWDGESVPGERPCAVLRALVEAGPRGLSEGALLEAVWGEDLPTTGAKALHVVVSRVRSLTSVEAVERTQTGYRIGLSVDDVDLWAARPQGLALAAAGQYAEALPLLALAVPDDEVIEARLRALAEVEGLPAALVAFEEYRSDLETRLGIDPSPGLRALHLELIHRDRPVKTGVRFDSDPMIGRGEDLRAIQALLRPPSTRVVSIVGPGGLGKTRLAHLVGRAAEQPIVHFVGLASVTAASGVAVEIADALGVQGSVTAALSGGGRPGDIVDRLVEAIGTVPSLLILDNCEQIVEGVADLVAQLIRRTPALTVLTTTRSPLGLTAERVYLLPQLSTAEGVVLFRERASAARPGVNLDDAAIAPLVERLDGLPLAVELAAAKVRVMSVSEIARRLDNRFTLLRGGSRDAPQRHQTLLAVIDWSWNLLSGPQREALRMLSVFRAGFSLDGAEAVVGAEALERIAELIDQSLVVIDEGSGGVRYRLLETVREFGQMQLVDAGQDGAAVKSVGDWAGALARGAQQLLYSPDQIATVTALRAEEGNLVEALRGALEADEVGLVVDLFAALSTFWTIEGSHLKVLRFAEPMSEFLASRAIPVDRTAAARIALVAVISHRLIFPGEIHPGVLAALRQLGPADGSGTTAAHQQVALTLAEGVTVESDRDPADLLEELCHDRDRAVAQLANYWTSHVLENSGQAERAWRSAQRALECCSPEDGPSGEASVHAHLAGLALQSGEWRDAGHHADCALETLTAIGAHEDAAQLRAIKALVALRAGEIDEADRIFDQVAAEDPGQSVFGAGVALICGRAEVLLARGDVTAGLARYASATDEIRVRTAADHRLAGLRGFDGDEPWLMLPLAASLAARCRAGRFQDAQPDRDALLRQVQRLVGAHDVWVDFPVLGCLLVGLGAWESVQGQADAATELVALGEAFSANRMLPSLDPAWGAPLADPERVARIRAGYAGCRPADLLTAAAGLLGGIRGQQPGERLDTA